MAAELSSQQTATLTHAELEELVAARGRELLRQLVQDHLDLRAAREEQAVARLHQEGRGEVAPTVWCDAASKPVITGCWPPSSAR